MVYTNLFTLYVPSGREGDTLKLVISERNIFDFPDRPEMAGKQ